MNRTERAELLLGIAHRIQAEKAAGRNVDASRLEWAEFIVKANGASRVPLATIPAPPRAFSGAEA